MQFWKTLTSKCPSSDGICRYVECGLWKISAFLLYTVHEHALGSGQNCRAGEKRLTITDMKKETRSGVQDSKWTACSRLGRLHLLVYYSPPFNILTTFWLKFIDLWPQYGNRIIFCLPIYIWPSYHLKLPLHGDSWLKLLISKLRFLHEFHWPLTLKYYLSPLLLNTNLSLGTFRLQWTRTRERSRDNVCPGLPAIKGLLRMRRVLNVRRHVHYPNLERQTDRFHVVLM